MALIVVDNVYVIFSPIIVDGGILVIAISTLGSVVGLIVFFTPQTESGVGEDSFIWGKSYSSRERVCVRKTKNKMYGQK